MKDRKNISPKIQASDLLEQIVKVNRMVDLHADDPFMREQYQALKQDFMRQPNTVLQELRLQLTELAAWPRKVCIDVMSIIP